MNIIKISNSQNNNYHINCQKPISFGAAKDINLNYILSHHVDLLPPRVHAEIKSLCQAGKGNSISLFDLHTKLYSKLMQCSSLQEAKELYPEFADVIEISSANIKRSKAIAPLNQSVPSGEVSLELLKRLYLPQKMDTIVQEFNLTNRSILSWLIDKLHIVKLKTNYIKLYKMSNEEENKRIAELSRQAIYANPEAQKERLDKAAQTHKTEAYRKKKSREMKEYFDKNPHKREEMRLIAQRTWDKCPEIKQALKDYTQTSSSYIKTILTKKNLKQKLSEQEKKMISAYYKDFWDKHCELKEIYQKKRLEVLAELKETSNI